MKTYSFASFNYIDADITIGANTIFYRGIDQQIPNENVIRPNVPMFLGPIEIAKEYGNVYKIKTTRSLKLLDFRRLKNLMRLVITSRKSMTSNTMRNQFMHCVELITIAFGLCSYQFQIELLSKYIDRVEHLADDKNAIIFIRQQIEKLKDANPTHMLNPLEPEGVRIAETNIDRSVMFIIKELFGKVYDGYIAPKMYSPFHVGNASHEEILIFDPIKSGLVVSIKEDDVVKEPISNILLTFNVIEFEDVHFKRSVYAAKTGGGFYKNKNRNDMFQDTKKVKEAAKLATFFSSKTRYKVTETTLGKTQRHPYLKIDQNQYNVEIGAA